MDSLPDHIKKRIDYVLEIIGDSTNDWLIIKRELLNSVSNEIRAMFSIRNFMTHKHALNDFDRLVMSYWESESGVKLTIDPQKVHDPNYVSKGRSWKIREINALAHQRKLEREKLLEANPQPKRKRGRPRKENKDSVIQGKNK